MRSERTTIIALAVTFWPMRAAIGSLYRRLIPQSPVSMPPIHRPYCSMRGSLSPSDSRSPASAVGLLWVPMIIMATSPGRMWVIANVTMEMRKRVRTKSAPPPGEIAHGRLPARVSDALPTDAPRVIRGRSASAERPGAHRERPAGCGRNLPVDSGTSGFEPDVLELEVRAVRVHQPVQSADVLACRHRAGSGTRAPRRGSRPARASGPAL